MSRKRPASDAVTGKRPIPRDAPRRATGGSRPGRAPGGDRVVDRQMLDAGSGDDPVDDTRRDDAVDEAVDDRAATRAGADAGNDAGNAAGAGNADDEAVEGEVADEATPEGGELDVDLDQAAEQFEVDLELLLSEREEYLEAFRRTQADFENYRKQAQRRQEDAVVRALGGFVESLLPVFDACDAALAHGAREVEPILSALYTALNKEGLERIDPKGASFDPTEAEAVAHEPGGGGDHVVAEVLRPGYRWRGRVLRPAMVKVTD